MAHRDRYLSSAMVLTLATGFTGFTGRTGAAGALLAQDANYDESAVPAYSLPDPLVCENGDRVTTLAQWQTRRRDEVLELFRGHVYGRPPEISVAPRFETLACEPGVLGGLAMRKEVRIRLGDARDPHAPSFDLLVYLPSKARGPVPIVLGLNFRGNHTVHADPGIRVSRAWIPSDPDRGVVGHRATERARGTSASRWPIEFALSRGYGVATIYCGDIDPDFHDGFENGIHAIESLRREGGERPLDAGGSIAAWAWGLSRAVDYFEIDEAIDARRVVLIGHSRLGKTSLWAGAEDERFAVVVSNNSGCGGAALSRRAFGETVARINRSFPHWFCRRFHGYGGREAEIPVDQHELIALIAPRPVYVASASEDRWADPRGEFLAARFAEPVYALFGLKGLGVEEPPAVNTPVGARIGYHLREGRHDITEYDWARYLDFADRHLGTP